MEFIFNRDERIRIGKFLVIVFVIQAIVFSIFNIYTLKNINNDYIKQNISIIGEINKYNSDLSEHIAPIITGKSVGDYEAGIEVMSKYSYDENLKYKFNPLLENIQKKYNYISIIIILITTIISISGIVYIINPIKLGIEELTIRAEAIVENRFNKKKSYNKKAITLERFTDKFSLMEERIKSSIQLLKDEKINLKNIINDISHQLKTPLTALQMYNDILEDHRDMNDSEIDDFINLSKEQLERMEWLVKTLLKYARLESNVVQYNKNKFSLANTIEEAINPLRIKANEKSQKLNFIVNKDIEYYHDRNWVGEAISNIVKNGIEHTGENGTIEVKLDETPLTVVISIKDNGEGIEKSEIRKIFNRFHKGQNSVNPTSIGIGLCLSKSIINAHNGDITVESEIGKGSTFYITFLKTIYD